MNNKNKQSIFNLTRSLLILNRALCVQTLLPVCLEDCPQPSEPVLAVPRVSNSAVPYRTYFLWTKWMSDTLFHDTQLRRVI